MANVKELKNGDLILVKFEGKDCKAKFLKLNQDGTKFQTLVQGRLQWLMSEALIEKLQEEKGLDPKVKKEPKPVAKKEKAEKPVKSPPKSSGDEKSKEEQPKAQAKEKEAEKPVKLSAHQIKILEALGVNGAIIEINELAMITGVLNPQIRKAAEGLTNSGLITCEESETTGTKYQSTETGEQLIKNQTQETMAKKVVKKAPAKKVKAKKDGPVELSKKDQILALLKDKSKTIEDIAEKMDTDSNYVREIKASVAKTMDEPEPDSTKGKVFKALKAGKSAKEAAAIAKVSNVYAYKVRLQMLAAGVI